MAHGKTRMTPTLSEIARSMARILGVTLEPGFLAEPAGQATSGALGPQATSEVLAAQPLPVSPAPAPLPIVFTEHASRGWHLDVTVAATQVVDAARLLDRLGFCLDLVTGVDWMARQEMEVVYDYLHFESSARVVVRTRVPRDAAEVPTISDIFQGANWHERETHEFLGIRFAGHPNLTPLLLPEDATFHPLRKDFVA